MRDKLNELIDNTRGQMGGRDLPGVMIALIVAAVVGAVGLFVLSDVYDEVALTSGDDFYNASTSLSDAVNSAFGLVGVAFIVIILSVVIFYLSAMRSGR